MVDLKTTKGNFEINWNQSKSPICLTIKCCYWHGYGLGWIVPLCRIWFILTFKFDELSDFAIWRFNSINFHCHLLICNKTSQIRKNILLTLAKSNNNVSIIIDDDGPGISKKERENVFKPFYKIDKGRNDSKSSVGLGLSIAADIIRSHGGSIRLEESPNSGLRVKIFLPF